MDTESSRKCGGGRGIRAQEGSAQGKAGAKQPDTGAERNQNGTKNGTSEQPLERVRRLVATCRAGEADSLTREEVADLIEVWAGVRDAAAGRAPMRGSFPYTAGYQLAREFAPAPPLRGPAAAMPIPQLTPAECHRLLSRIRITDGCWVWTGRTVSVGYGALTIGGRQTLAHRAMWRLLRGETPGQLRNTCGNRLCCRPDHMVSSTPSSEGRRLDPAVADLVASFLRQEGAE